jgi:hypothetical protein
LWIPRIAQGDEDAHSVQVALHRHGSRAVRQNLASATTSAGSFPVRTHTQGVEMCVAASLQAWCYCVRGGRVACSCAVQGWDRGCPRHGSHRRCGTDGTGLRGGSAMPAVALWLVHCLPGPPSTTRLKAVRHGPGQFRDGAWQTQSAARVRRHAARARNASHSTEAGLSFSRRPPTVNPDTIIVFIYHSIYGLCWALFSAHSLALATQRPYNRSYPSLEASIGESPQNST